ncbi:MAG: GerMN domain-containing protein [Actinomycetota bacterium]|nr:GerMN domain-containing protein [Actinomycetota bacterium]
MTWRDDNVQESSTQDIPGQHGDRRFRPAAWRRRRQLLWAAAAVAVIFGTLTPRLEGGAAASAASRTTVALYWLRGGVALGVSHRAIPATPRIGAATLQALLGGPNRTERAAGLSSAVPSGSHLRSLSITDGVARADFDARFASGGGSLSVIGRVDQVVYTLTQFPSVRRVLFLVNGKLARTFTGEGLVLDRPVARSDERSLLPPIFVERPAVGDVVRSPLRLSGLANTFEATFQVNLLDAGGRIVVRRTVHASAGTGTWGTYSQSLSFTKARPGNGRLVVFERSAKDGRPIHVVRIPVRLAG